jgi:YD repeat-containing protein
LYQAIGGRGFLFKTYPRYRTKTTYIRREYAWICAEFGYDADGNVTSMVDGTDEASFSYDQLGRLTRSEDGHDHVVGYGYDLAEELTGMGLPERKASRAPSTALGGWKASPTGSAAPSSSGDRAS